MAALAETVILECIKIRSRLRVRVISPGYFRDANCQFPRALRSEGARYSVPKQHLRFIQGGNRKYYYSAPAKHVTVLAAGAAVAQDPAAPIDLHVYTDAGETECLVCFDADKAVVLVPCGHYCLCAPCAQKLNGSCPMCRAPIQQIATREQINAL